jgi:hypothetical protein
VGKQNKTKKSQAHESKKGPTREVEGEGKRGKDKGDKK